MFRFASDFGTSAKVLFQTKPNTFFYFRHLIKMIRGFILKRSCFQLTQTQDFYFQMGKWNILILEEFGDTTLRAIKIGTKEAL